MVKSNSSACGKVYQLFYDQLFDEILGVKGATMFTKGDVNGSHQRPTYQFLKAAGVVNRVSVFIASSCSLLYLLPSSGISKVASWCRRLEKVTMTRMI